MDEDTRARIRALESRIRKLEVMGEVVAELLGKSEVDRRVRERLRSLQRDDREEDASTAQGEGGVRGSVYRGTSPTDAMGALSCGLCRRPLDADDPQITLPAAGRVCLSCSQREPR